MTYRFEGFEIDPEQFALIAPDGPRPLEPQVFDLLVALVDNRHRVMTKTELLELVWPDRIVEESNLAVRVNALRRALGDTGDSQRFIKTVRGRGYQFVADVDVIGTAPKAPLHLAPAALHGRAHELGRLREAVAAVAEGSGDLVFVSGNAGMGKTTLLDAALRGLPPEFVVGTGQSLDRRSADEPYMAVIEAFGEILRTLGTPAIEAFAEVAPTWLAQLPWLIPPSLGSTVQERMVTSNPARMLREGLAGLAALSRIRPIILRLEDIHWSDHATVDFVESFARNRQDTRALIVASVRPADIVEDSHPLAALIPQLVHRGLATELSLDPLALEAVGAYVASTLGVSPSEELTELIHQRTEGHPLFMTAVLGDWIARGLVDDGAVSDALRDAANDLPAGVRVLVQQRFEGLADASRAALLAGATAGLRFCAAEVAAATETELEDVEDTLDALARTGALILADDVVVWPDGAESSGYRFVHGVHREVIYDQLSPARAARFHRALGDRLEAAWGADANQIAALLADHLTRGREVLRAVNYRLAAAESALRRNAHREAIRQCEVGLASVAKLPATDGTRTVEVDLALTLAAPLIGRDGWSSPNVPPLYHLAIENAEILGDRSRLVKALFGNSYYHEYRGELVESQRNISRIMDFSDDLDPSIRLGASLIMACSCYHQGRFDETVAHADRAILGYEPEEHVQFIGRYGSDPWVGSLRWSGLALGHLGEHDAAQQRITDALELGRRPAHQNSLSAALEGQSILCQLRGDVAATEEFAKRAIDDALRYDFKYRELTSSIMLGWARARAGHEDGIDMMAAALTAYRSTSAVLDLPYFLTLFAEAHLTHGNPERALAVLEEVDKLGVLRRGINTEHEQHVLKEAVLRELDRPEDAAAAAEIARAAAARRRLQAANAVANA